MCDSGHGAASENGFQGILESGSVYRFVHAFVHQFVHVHAWLRLLSGLNQ